MLTLERLKHLLSYDPATGIWTWLNRPSVKGGNIVPGREAGSVDESRQGRRRIMIDGAHYSCNQLAWFYVKGEWPAGFTDHRDRSAGNDVFTNLRPVSRSQNNMNRRAFSATGLKGVYRRIRGGRVRFEVYLSNPRKYVGGFDSPIQAAWVYDAEAVHHYGEFAVLNFLNNPT